VRALLILLLLVSALQGTPARAGDGLDSVQMPALREAMRSWPELAQAWFRLRAGDAEGARLDAKALARLRPQSAEAQHLLGIAASACGKHTEAVAALKRSLKLKADAWVATHLVHDLAHRGKAKAALKISAELLKKLPREPQMIRTHAWALVAAGLIGEARPVLEELEKQRPDGETAWQLAVLHFALRDPEAGIAAAKRAVERNPREAVWRKELLGRLHDAARWEELLAVASKGGAESEAGAQSAWYRGVALAKLGRRDEAVRALAAVVEHAEADALTVVGASAWLLQLSAEKEAEAAARRALTEQDSSPALHHLLAMTLTRQQREDEGLAHYRRAADLEPGNVDYRYDLSVSLCALGRREELEVELQRVDREFGPDARFTALAERCLPAAE
jgi:tetratricopeptide (TPR) repeat protein